VKSFYPAEDINAKRHVTLTAVKPVKLRFLNNVSVEKTKESSNAIKSTTQKNLERS